MALSTRTKISAKEASRLHDVIGTTTIGGLKLDLLRGRVCSHQQLEHVPYNQRLKAYWASTPDNQRNPHPNFVNLVLGYMFDKAWCAAMEVAWEWEDRLTTAIVESACNTTAAATLETATKQVPISHFCVTQLLRGETREATLKAVKREYPDNKWHDYHVSQAVSKLKREKQFTEQKESR